MGLELLSPLFLAGLAAAAVPVVIHLIHRRQARILPIATLRFLRQVPARTTRKHRLEEYLLLAARALLIALLALAGARPVLRDAQASGGATAVAIVLDDSFSMGCRRDGVTRFQEASEAVVKVLRTLEPGDRAAVVRTSAPGDAALGSDLTGLARRAGSVRPGRAAPTLGPAVDAALRRLREADEPNRELVIVTDLQARALADLGTIEVEDEGIRVVLVDVGAPDAVNLSVTGVSTGAWAAVAGEEGSVRATIRNSADREATARVTLSIGADSVAHETVTLAAREEREVTLAAAVDVPGAEAGRVSLDPDDLLADDERHFALKVLGRIPVLLVNGDPSPIPYQDEAFFLRAALAPEDLGAAEGAGLARLKTVEPIALADEDLSTYRVVVLANVGALEPRAANRVRAFVRSGGGLLLFTGSRVRAEDWNRTLGREPGALLPGLLSPPVQVGDDPDAVLRVEKPEGGHPLLSGLSPEAVRDFGRIHVRRAFGLETGPREGVVVAAFENGVPFLVEREAGRGRVLLVNASADADWGNLPLRPLFLPLLHRAVRLLSGSEEERRGWTVGDRVAIPPPPPSAPLPEVTDPRGEVARPSPEPAPDGSLPYGPLEVPGIHRVKGSGREGSFLFAANRDPAEGDLRRGSPGIVRDRFGPEGFRLLAGTDDVDLALRRSREGRPLWGALLVAALLLLLFETFFANRVARKRAGNLEETG